MKITILKVAHAGEREPRKLLSYIKECDAFSVEWAGCYEPHAEKFESIWLTLLGKADRITRSGFLQIYDTTLMSDTNEPFTFRQYKRAIFDYMFVNRVPLCFTERWQAEGYSKNVMSAYRLGTSNAKNGLELLKDGKEEGLRRAYEGWKLAFNSVAERDRNIAANLGRMESLLKTRYPHLAERNIKLCVAIGHSHQVEKHAEVECVELMDMSDPVTRLVVRMEDMAYNHAPFEDASPLLRELAPYVNKIFV